MTDLHELKGNEEQCRYLREAIDHYRMVLMRFGGLDVHVDSFIRARDDSMSAWQVKLDEVMKQNEKKYCGKFGGVLNDLREEDKDLY